MQEIYIPKKFPNVPPPQSTTILESVQGGNFFDKLGKKVVG